MGNIHVKLHKFLYLDQWLGKCCLKFDFIFLALMAIFSVEGNQLCNFD